MEYLPTASALLRNIPSAVGQHREIFHSVEYLKARLVSIGEIFHRVEYLEVGDCPWEIFHSVENWALIPCLLAKMCNLCTLCPAITPFWPARTNFRESNPPPVPVFDRTCLP